MCQFHQSPEMTHPCASYPAPDDHILISIPGADRPMWDAGYFVALLLTRHQLLTAWCVAGTLAVKRIAASSCTERLRPACLLWTPAWLCLWKSGCHSFQWWQTPVGPEAVAGFSGHTVGIRSHGAPLSPCADQSSALSTRFQRLHILTPQHLSFPLEIIVTLRSVIRETGNHIGFGFLITSNGVFPRVYWPPGHLPKEPTLHRLHPLYGSSCF